jgi:hypothetical protein
MDVKQITAPITESPVTRRGFFKTVAAVAAGAVAAALPETAEGHPRRRFRFVNPQYCPAPYQYRPIVPIVPPVVVTNAVQNVGIDTFHITENGRYISSYRAPVVSEHIVDAFNRVVSNTIDRARVTDVHFDTVPPVTRMITRAGYVIERVGESLARQVEQVKQLNPDVVVRIFRAVK